MTTLHLDADGCRSAILDYRRRLRELTGLVRRDGVHGAAPTALAELRGRLDADVRGRSTLEGQAAMTSLETRLLEPSLRQARIALAFPVRAEARDWLLHLAAADACFLVALSRVNGARPRVAPVVPAPQDADDLPAAWPPGVGQPSAGDGNPRIASNRYS